MNRSLFRKLCLKGRLSKYRPTKYRQTKYRKPKCRWYKACLNKALYTLDHLHFGYLYFGRSLSKPMLDSLYFSKAQAALFTAMASKTAQPPNYLDKTIHLNSKEPEQTSPAVIFILLLLNLCQLFTISSSR
jgi:hypothetical protein